MGIEEAPKHELPFEITSSEYFGDFYVLLNQRAEFSFVAGSPCDSFSISKKYLLLSVFKNYQPSFLKDFQDRAVTRYFKIREIINKHRKRHLDTLNNNNTYFALQLI